MKKRCCLLALCFLIVLAFAGCGSQSSQGEDSDVSIRVAALKGPTGMGMAKLMEMRPNDTFIIESAADSIVGKLTSGEVDIAALPTNLGATLYNKTDGAVQMAAINTLGVLYLLSYDDNVKNIGDLAGKTVVSAGQGTTAQYIFDYVLQGNGLVPGEDVTMDYRSEHSETATLAVAQEGDTFLLPEPFVTAVRQKNGDIHVVADLTEEWDDVNDSKTQLPMGGLVVRKAFAEEQPEAFAQFLRDYETSTQYVNNNPADASKLMQNYDIMEENVARAAIPNCNIVFITGAEMKKALTAFYQVLYNANPSSIGGGLPGDDFYLD